MVWREDEHESASFLAVVPPRVIVDKIADLQRIHGVADAFVAHITVKGQPGLGHRHRWVDHVRSALDSEPPFRVRFVGVDSFGDDIVFLRPAGDELHRLHHRILGALDSTEIGERWEYDGDAFEPHLTLGAAFAGADRDTLRALSRAAARLDLVPFEVTEVIEFHRPARGAAYAAVERFSLRGDTSGSAEGPA